MRLDFGRPLVMGILNATPDSFSDGGRFLAPTDALPQVRNMIAEGADIIDIGGESTRPGAQPVSLEDEIQRVVPLIRVIRLESDIPISIDTSKPGVMRAAVAAGASMINDVCALREPGALAAAAELEVPVCVMHMQGEPRTMQKSPQYVDVVEEVYQFLQERVAACREAGIPDERLIVDPGFGFGKRLEHNLQLIKGLQRIVELGLPILAGVSRKTMLGEILDKPVDERLYGSVAAAVMLLERGATILRVHDVAATVDAVKVYLAAR